MKEYPYLCFIECPVCGSRIGLPFSRLSGPVPFVHKGPRACGARLIVWPARSGDAHRVSIVRDDQSLEDALELALTIALAEERAAGHDGQAVNREANTPPKGQPQSHARDE